jgi:hypothetical protein
MQYAAGNPYYPLVDNAIISLANNSWTQTSGCKSQVRVIQGRDASIEIDS